MGNSNLALSIVVPTLNEVDNVAALVQRIDASVTARKIAYEIIFIDDHSVDGTPQAIAALARKYPVVLQSKIGKRGKAYSVLQGFRAARYEYVCMIDADLQYPPEAIADMLGLLIKAQADLILSRRVENGTSLLRRLSSTTYNLLFTRFLFGINYDTQSGLKVFRRQLLDGMALNPSPWSFDLEFIIRCLQRNYKILSFDIPFSSRHSGKAKVRLLRTTVELSRASLRLRAGVSKKQVKKAYQSNVKFANDTLAALAISILALGVWL